MTLASVAGPGEGITAAEIVVVNSADSSEMSLECQGDVAQEVIGDINTMGYARWRELCAIEMQARKRTQLDAGMTVEPEIGKQVEP